MADASCQTEWLADVKLKQGSSAQCRDPAHAKHEQKMLGLFFLTKKHVLSIFRVGDRS